MDFARVELSKPDTAFLEEVRALLHTVVTDDVVAHNRESGENFNERVHLTLAEAGFLERQYRPRSEGGLNAIRRRIWALEIARAHTPWFAWSTTAMIAHIVEQFGSAELVEEVLPGVLDGRVRLCLGYTEPEGGSDVASCKTRAVPDGETWIINGSKMFTSHAQNAQYVFLITNTDRSAAKHKGLTMFLVPLATSGVEIQAIRTVDGDRTNITYYSDVRVSDRYRVGDVNGG